MASLNLLALLPWIYYVYAITPWLSMGCGTILVAAALLHWQRTRHWCLLTMAAGAFLVILGGLVARIGFMQATRVVLSSGMTTLESSLFLVSQWLVLSGQVVIAIGGIGAIQWAIRLRQPRQLLTPPSSAG